ncbi:DUF6438 domain-containing protein [Sphingomonas sp. MMS24-JH45]
MPSQGRPSCSQDAPPPPARAGRSRSRRRRSAATAPCYGTCPVYAVTVQPDGSGTFEGKRFTAVTGTRSFTMTPAAYRAFAAMLAPHEPNGERLVQPGTPDCRNAPTDMPSVEVRWTQLSGANDHLVFYRGCRTGNDAMAEARQRAPDLLPIADLIGKR